MAEGAVKKGSPRWNPLSSFGLRLLVLAAAGFSAMKFAGRLLSPGAAVPSEIINAFLVIGAGMILYGWKSGEDLARIAFKVWIAACGAVALLFVAAYLG